MANYIYTAKSSDGKTQNGILNAHDEHQLAQVLKSQGMVLIRSSLENTKKPPIWKRDLAITKVSSTDKIMMTKNLGVMFSTGLSLTKSFEILSMQAKNKRLKVALLEIRDSINKGENLSDALSRYPDIFNELFCNMMKVGEESGTLDEIFQVLALQLTKEHELKSKIINAMIYPCIVLMVMLIVGIVMVTFVLPNLSVFFTSLNVDLPIYTKVMLFLGDFLAKNWWLIPAAPAVFGLMFWLILKTKWGKNGFDTLLLKLPLVSAITKKNNSAFLIRSLSSLISSGVSLIRALEISAKTVSNHYFSDALIDASKEIKKGERLSNALKKYQNLFPVGVIEMVQVGEETGKTDVILKKLADFYEQEAVSAIEKLSLLIEPALIIGLGLGVGLFAFSIIQPMYSSLKSIG